MNPYHRPNAKSRARKAILAALALAMIAVMAAPASATTIVPPPSGTTFTVNAGPGDQIDPHVSGDLVAYTDQPSGSCSGCPSTIHYYNIATGVDASVPPDPAGSFDFLSDVSGSRIVFTRVTTSSSAIYLFDTAAPSTPPVELAPQTGSQRQEPSIGGNTVAWQDFGFDPAGLSPEIVAYNLTSGVTTRLTNDTLFDQTPSVSPDGSTIAWGKCTGGGSGCYIIDATLSGGVWTTRQLTSPSTSLNCSHPDTDGQVVVYSCQRLGANQIYYNQIYEQPVAGGAEQVVSPSPTASDLNPSIAAGKVAYQSQASIAINPDIFEADLAAGTAFQVSQTPDNENLNDISLVATGFVNIVWQVSVNGQYDVQGFRFQPNTDTTPPTVNIAFTPNGDNSWFKTSPATGTVSATDPSNVSAINCTVDGNPATLSGLTGLGTGSASGTLGVSGEGTHSVSCTATDGVGNTGAASGSTNTAKVKIDTVAPSESVTGVANGAVYTLGAVPAAGCSTSDATSGVMTNATVSVTGGDANGVGSFTATCTGAVDNAGNPQAAPVSATYKVQYKFIGFFAPVNNPPTVNTGKAGKTYAVKWQLTDANGVYVTTLSAVTNITYKSTSCSSFTGDPTDALETSTTGSSSLRYDSTANQYVYHWATPAAGCYTLFVTLDDGNVISAYFNLN